MGWLSGTNKYLIRKSGIWSDPGWGSKVTSWILLSPWWSTVLRPAGAVDSAVSKAVEPFLILLGTHTQAHTHTNTFTLKRLTRVELSAATGILQCHICRGCFGYTYFGPNYHYGSYAVGCIVLLVVQLDCKLRKHPEPRWLKSLEDKRM